MRAAALLNTPTSPYEVPRGDSPTSCLVLVVGGGGINHLELCQHFQNPYLSWQTWAHQIRPDRSLPAPWTGVLVGTARTAPCDHSEATSPQGEVNLVCSLFVNTPGIQFHGSGSSGRGDDGNLLIPVLRPHW